MLRGQAELARVRNYNLVFYLLDQRAMNEFVERIRSRRLRAVTSYILLQKIMIRMKLPRKYLINIREEYGEIVSIGIGDTVIDILMLRGVDISVALSRDIDPCAYGLLENK